MTDPVLILYSTWGCHLCEQAAQLLHDAKLSFREVDIVDDPEAFAQFRTAIPVLGCGSSYLYWPFDQAALTAFVSQLYTQGK